jgi:hypothetical protein
LEQLLWGRQYAKYNIETDIGDVRRVYLILFGVLRISKREEKGQEQIG